MLVQGLRIRRCSLRTPSATEATARTCAASQHTTSCVTGPQCTSDPGLCCLMGGARGSAASARGWPARAQRLLMCHVRSLQLLQQTLATCLCLLLQSLFSPAVACWAYSAPSSKGGPVAIMRAPELTGQEDTLQLHRLMMKVIKTMEAVSEVLQDLRFDAESE